MNFPGTEKNEKDFKEHIPCALHALCTKIEHKIHSIGSCREECNGAKRQGECSEQGEGTTMSTTEAPQVA